MVRQRSAERGGSVIVLMLFMLVALLALSSFAIGISQIQLIRGEAQIVADSAALSAASVIGEPFTVPDLRPRRVARNIAALNEIGGRPANINLNDTVLGSAQLLPDSRIHFDGHGMVGANAARVTIRLDDGSAMGRQALWFPLGGSLQTFSTVRSSIASRVSVDVALVIDRSSSMNARVTVGRPPPLDPHRPFATFYPHPTESRWAGAVEAVDVILKHFRESPIDERVSLITFGSDRWINFMGEDVFFPGSRIDIPLTRDYGLIEQTLDHMWDYYPMISGQTWIDAGIDDAIKVLTGDPERGFAMKVMVVLTDGLQAPKSNLHYQAAERAAAQGITIHAVAYSSGVGIDEVEVIAGIGGGRAFKADTAEALREVFAELGRLTSTAVVE